MANFPANKSGKGKKQYTDISNILNGRASNAKLQNYIDEVCRCKTRIMDENESIKGIREAAVEELNVDPKTFNTLVSLFFNNDFIERLEEIQQIEFAIESLTSTMAIDSNEMERIEVEDAREHADNEE